MGGVPPVGVGAATAHRTASIIHLAASQAHHPPALQWAPNGQQSQLLSLTKLQSGRGLREKGVRTQREVDWRCCRVMAAAVTRGSGLAAQLTGESLWRVAKNLATKVCT